MSEAISPKIDSRKTKIQMNAGNLKVLQPLLTLSINTTHSTFNEVMSLMSYMYFTKF